MQAPVFPDQAAQQQAAAMMYMQMAQMGPPNPAMLGGVGGVAPPWPQAPMPMVSNVLNVQVQGLKFEYQLTEEDVKKVFSRYGGVKTVNVDKDGTKASVTFEHPTQAVSAQNDLNQKQLAGMSGARLQVDFAPTGNTAPAMPTFDPTTYAMATAANPWMAQMLPGGLPGYPTMPTMPSPVAPGASPKGDRAKKHTCKLEVGIENESEFRVGSRVIQIAKEIWQDPFFKQHGGKTRLRGKGIGGPHEADEPLALCISCRDQNSFDNAVHQAEMKLQKVHSDYKAFCQNKGLPIPELSVKVSNKVSTFSEDRNFLGGTDLPKGERPAHAPEDKEIENLIEQRNEARKAANYKKADEIRDQLKAQGVVLMDEKGAKGNYMGNEVTKWRYWRE